MLPETQYYVVSNDLNFHHRNEFVGKRKELVVPRIEINEFLKKARETSF
jgi:hypothetical protein